MNTKMKLLAGFTLMLLLLTTVTLMIVKNMPDTPPLIHGILIPEAIPLNRFTIVDHYNQPFSNNELLGNWHLVTYGYTHCPDVCPTTLAMLSRFHNQLKSLNKFNNLNIAFYSIDYQRDTVSHLAEYIPHFNSDFIGLTSNQQTKDSAQAFESSLSMVSILTPVENNEGIRQAEAYKVSHGFMLYLINPDGELQAVLKPEVGKNGILYFTEQQLLMDYLAIRNYLG